MVNTNKLKGRIIEKGYTIRSIAWELRESPATVCRKLKNMSCMTLDEVGDLCRLLDIKKHEILEFFFVEEA